MTNGTLDGRTAPWSAEAILDDGQRERVDIPAPARIAYNGLLLQRLEEDLCWIVPHVPPTTISARDWTELNSLLSLYVMLFICLFLILPLKPVLSALTLNSSCDSSFYYAALSVWNSLPREVRHIQSTTAFRTALKTHLLKSYFY